jgi:hypothetical protein
MPVAINQFEVMPEAANRDSRGGGDSGGGAAPAKPDPAELQRVLAQIRELELRLWAH